MPVFGVAVAEGEVRELVQNELLRMERGVGVRVEDAVALSAPTAGNSATLFFRPRCRSIASVSASKVRCSPRFSAAIAAATVWLIVTVCSLSVCEHPRCQSVQVDAGAARLLRHLVIQELRNRFQGLW